MKHLSFLVFILFFSIQLWGQDSTIQDKITLKSGEVYFGEIVVRTAEMVMIKTLNGTRYQFQLSEVTKIEKRPDNQTSVENIKNLNQNISTENNFCGNIELSAGISNAKNSFSLCPTTELSMIFGNKRVLGKDIFMGLGIGYNMTLLSQNSNPISFLPLFLRLQSTLTKNRTAPFIGIDAGYAFGLNSDYSGGTLVKVSIGITRKLSYKTALFAGIYSGITSISGKITETNDLGTFSYLGHNSMINFGLKFGFQF